LEIDSASYHPAYHRPSQGKFDDIVALAKLKLKKHLEKPTVEFHQTFHLRNLAKVSFENRPRCDVSSAIAVQQTAAIASEWIVAVVDFD
jgi:hypothetical protein